MKKILFLISFYIYAFASNDIAQIRQTIENLDTIINASVWNVRYDNFIKYEHINDELILLNLELKKNLSPNQKEEITRKIATLQEQLNLLKDYKDINFIQSLSAPETIEILPKLTNPLAIIEGFSHIKKLTNEKEEYVFKYNDFKNLVEKIREKNSMLKELVTLEPNKNNTEALKLSDKKLDEFEQALQFASVSFSVYEKKVDEEITRVNVEIKVQSIRAANILITIIFVIVVSFLLKFIARKYIKDNERYYTATKIINFININLIFLILLFAYIENITYLVTILGFASAGLAIAMKDMFMSMLGWCVIVFGGSFRVGDRIKVIQNDLTYVGDIIDISFLRITIYEDITWESYIKNRRSGRIIFIPNNYVFTHLIANYTHHGMKTVLDGIDITITFDSNLEKAGKIVEKIVIQHAKGYTELTKKTMLKLQDEYSIKNPKVEPRFFMFFENWGMRISAWYMTNSYAALSLRSAISKEIIKEFNKHEDIKIAYPSQNLYLGKNTPTNFKEGEMF
ncbi:mechanosensitive ion channel family protein [Campylobacter cuniculorum]|uniref:Mechanosensitive ion channel family protein n=2 Tax=Campylobacter cuniculorum TaxID=374106 RepID=A0A1W6BWU9_9BACT|nr:mechanosensitive ion channel domain-containing protein [Campylobacter cuniculorum]ARJ56548.1 mechanosensitive ion channel family protein [Campylobacter cuniculorum DSM 23162 = LMG 24588]QOR04028.1 mechanosensitive ion channel [Campylobacter cuniculorum]